MHVYHKYIKHLLFILTSFVPKHQADLIVEGSIEAEVEEETIVAGKEKAFVEDPVAEFVKTPTQHDRFEPALANLAVMQSPAIWQTSTPKAFLYMVVSTVKCHWLIFLVYQR